MNSGQIIDLTLASNTINDVGQTASPVFGALFPIGILVGSILVGGLLVAAVVFGITGAVGNLVDRFSNHGK